MATQDYFIGEIRLFAFQKAPTDWLLCDGTEYQVQYFGALFSLIGITYGGDGATHFKVPDLRGRVPINQGQGLSLPMYPIGKQGGQEFVTLLDGQMASHSHSLRSSTLPATTQIPGTQVTIATNEPADADKLLYAPAASASPYIVMAPAVSRTGGNGPHNNMMPSLVGNYCICFNGQYPIRS